MTQLALALERFSWDDDRRLLRQMAEAIGLKSCAIDLDVSLSQLANGLDERERNLPAKWVAYMVENAPAILADEYVGRLAALRGKRLTDEPTLTPEQELAALKATQAEMLGPELHRVLLEKARRR